MVTPTANHNIFTDVIMFHMSSTTSLVATLPMIRAKKLCLVTWRPVGVLHTGELQVPGNWGVCVRVCVCAQFITTYVRLR